MLFLPEFKITFGCYICRVINGNRGSGKESKESCGYSGVGLFLRLELSLCCFFLGHIYSSFCCFTFQSFQNIFWLWLYFSF
ncbi:hypothetical protein JHK85_041481 [Glycine max]|uniref:Uncharacterized protein n=1 Tax=Glycine max TaxID=3847 RepID=K7M8B5_SOYBN|nr:hypothetical protein JHK85_041481 [Glycine max]KAH1095552.1 hypothetical protein GYH30_040714 [Glycine max]